MNIIARRPDAATRGGNIVNCIAKMYALVILTTAAADDAAGQIRGMAQHYEQISSILQYIAQLQQVNTAGFEAMSHPLPLNNVLREDEVKPSLSVQQVLQNAPSSEGPFFTVPQVLDATLGGG